MNLLYFNIYYIKFNPQKSHATVSSNLPLNIVVLHLHFLKNVQLYNFSGRVKLARPPDWSVLGTGQKFNIILNITENEQGVGVSSQPAHLTVQYRPLVSIRMEPATPVTETEHR